jgi:hypothetical protein
MSCGGAILDFQLIPKHTFCSEPSKEQFSLCFKWFISLREELFSNIFPEESIFKTLSAISEI